MKIAMTVAALLVATVLEAGGDAVVRTGLRSSSPSLRLLFLALGGSMLFGYGVFLTATQVDFGRLLGAYIVLFFIAAQAINYFAFGVKPTAGIVVGGACIVAGGIVIACYQR